MNYYQVLKALSKSIVTCKNISFDNLNVMPADDKTKNLVKQNLHLLPEKISQFYNEVCSVNVKWRGQSKELKDAMGSIKILEVSESMADWKEVIYFDEYSSLKYFKIIDFFSNEACSGYFTKASETYASGLIYYYNFEGEPFSLLLDIEGYVSMMVSAYGFRYWQKVLRDHRLGVQSPEYLFMQESLPKLFPGFDFEAFIHQYEQWIN